LGFAAKQARYQTDSREEAAAWRNQPTSGFHRHVMCRIFEQ
jgi:hypothetical protein